MSDFSNQLKETTYLMAVANKLAAEHGLEECDAIIANIAKIEPDYHSEEILCEVNAMYVQILDQQIKLRQIVDDSQRVIEEFWI